MKNISLGYSPCPNDTFIFYALIHSKIETGELSFNEVLLDVETLNQKALKTKLDVTKISYAAFGHLRKDYCLLRSGGALGRGCGPLVISKHNYDMEALRYKKIAIPGNLTTAYLLLQLYDNAFRSSTIIPMAFHEIMQAVSRGDVDAGVIIHESRFTYQSYGLKKIIDLGNWWEKETGLPIPLGGIVARRSLGDRLIKQIDESIKQSILYAFDNRHGPVDYIKQHSQELSDDVINQHINLYVNDFSVDLGDEGEKAVRELLSRAEEAGVIPKITNSLFIS
jgi:1,4-dihydroxy-6-naphthoate synthase